MIGDGIAADSRSAPEGTPRWEATGRESDGQWKQISYCELAYCEPANWALANSGCATGTVAALLHPHSAQHRNFGSLVQCFAVQLGQEGSRM